MRWRDVRWSLRVVAIEGLDIVRNVRAEVLSAIGWTALLFSALVASLVIASWSEIRVTVTGGLALALFCGSAGVAFAAFWFWLGARWALRVPR